MLALSASRGWAKPLVFAAVVAALAVAGAATGALGAVANGELAYALRSFTGENPVLAVMAYVVVTVVGCAALALPGALFAVLAAAMFGPIAGTLWCSVATTAGAVASFAAGRYFLRDAIRPRLMRHDLIRRWLLFPDSRHGAIATLAVTRLVPLFPFNLQNFAYGITDMPLGVFAAGTFVFIVPGTGLYAFAAAGVLDESMRGAYFASAAVLLAMVAVAGVALRRRMEEGTGRPAASRRSSFASRAADAIAVAEKAHYPFKNYRHAHAKSVLFVGCNVASLYPRTTRCAVTLLAEKGVGAAYDCCGAPLALEGDPARADRVRDRVIARLRARGVEEVVAICPTCAAVLSGAEGIRVVSVYRKLVEVGVASSLASDAAVFPPCPDRASGEWSCDVLSFFEGSPTVLWDAPCCGLGEGGGPKRPEAADAMARECLRRAREESPAPLYVYCASCAGSFAEHGEPKVRFALSAILGVDEAPQTRSALANRARAKFL